MAAEGRLSPQSLLELDFGCGQFGRYYASFLRGLICSGSVCLLCSVRKDGGWSEKLKAAHANEQKIALTLVQLDAIADN
jgi:hypothetical protein